MSPLRLGGMCSPPCQRRVTACARSCVEVSGETRGRGRVSRACQPRGGGETPPPPPPPPPVEVAPGTAMPPPPPAPAPPAPPTAVPPEPHAHRVRWQQRRQTGHPPPPPLCMARVRPPPASSRPPACPSRPPAPARARPHTYPAPAERGAGRPQHPPAMVQTPRRRRRRHRRRRHCHCRRRRRHCCCRRHHPGVAPVCPARRLAGQHWVAAVATTAALAVAAAAAAAVGSSAWHPRGAALTFPTCWPPTPYSLNNWLGPAAMARADRTGGPLCVRARRLRRVAARIHFVAIAVVGGGGKEVATPSPPAAG